MSDAIREVLDTMAKVLLRCWIIGIVVQFISLGAVLSMGEMLHDIHGSLFGLTIQESNMITASYLSLLKVCVTVFFITWLAIWLVLKKKND